MLVFPDPSTAKVQLQVANELLLLRAKPRSVLDLTAPRADHDQGNVTYKQAHTAPHTYAVTPAVSNPCVALAEP